MGRSVRALDRKLQIASSISAAWVKANNYISSLTVIVKYSSSRRLNFKTLQNMPEH